MVDKVIFLKTRCPMVIVDKSINIIHYVSGFNAHGPKLIIRDGFEESVYPTYEVKQRELEENGLMMIKVEEYEFHHKQAREYGKIAKYLANDKGLITKQSLYNVCKELVRIFEEQENK